MKVLNPEGLSQMEKSIYDNGHGKVFNAASSGP